MLVALVAALSLANVCAPGVAQAKSKSCAKRGYSIAQKLGATVVMTRAVRDKKQWDGTAESVYLCSQIWNRRFNIGTFGLSWDGEIAYGAMTLSRQFVTWSEGTSNNAGSVDFDHVYRADLRTGSKLTWPSGGASGDAYVGQTVVDEKGAVGWTVQYYKDNVSRSDVYLADASGYRIVGPDAGQHSLAFAERDGVRQLVWPTTVGSAPFVPGSGTLRYPKKPKRCGKSGYALDTRTGGSMVLLRGVRDAKYEGTSHRYYACSQNYGKRVTVGTFGVHSEGETCFVGQALGGRFAAFVTGSGGNVGGCSSNTILLADLKTGLKRAMPASTIPARYRISSIIVNDDGTVAWIAAEGAQQREIWTANLISTTKLAAGPEIDPQFLQFGLPDDFKRIAWATATDSATVN